MDRNRFRVSFLTAVMVLSALSGCGDRSAEREKEDIPGSAEESNVQGTINGGCTGGSGTGYGHKRRDKCTK